VGGRGGDGGLGLVGGWVGEWGVVCVRTHGHRFVCGVRARARVRVVLGGVRVCVCVCVGGGGGTNLPTPPWRPCAV
jgi:hypothetical protein